MKIFRHFPGTQHRDSIERSRYPKLSDPNSREKSKTSSKNPATLGIPGGPRRGTVLASLRRSIATESLRRIWTCPPSFRRRRRYPSRSSVTFFCAREVDTHSPPTPPTSHMSPAGGPHMPRTPPNIPSRMPRHKAGKTTPTSSSPIPFPPDLAHPTRTTTEFPELLNLQDEVWSRRKKVRLQRSPGDGPTTPREGMYGVRCGEGAD